MYDKLIDLINKTEKPITKYDFIEAYEKLGIKSDSLLEVHSSTSAFGYIINKEYDICDSLVETVTKGVIIMMGHTGEFSDPSEWVNPPVPKEWHSMINRHRKPFDKDLFIPERIGKVAALFSRYKNVQRTNHPTQSMSVLNNTDDPSWLEHDLDDTKTHNPLSKLAKSKGKILFIGTDFSSCTSIHLTEHLSPYSTKKVYDYQRLDDLKQIEDILVTLKYIDDDEVDNFKEIKKQYIEKYTDTEYLKQVKLGFGVITLIDAEKLFEVAEAFHRDFRK
ncbi:MAG: AAC(3) family N-acetyltransferase [Candidatus Izemoplasmatales bacterium]|jgi:aminoglycoside 3-N-acetyltransferase|nr:AAC(3) family N-acetyltransferase [Candidatus Izemoplasmatales bacterium]